MGLFTKGEQDLGNNKGWCSWEQLLPALIYGGWRASNYKKLEKAGVWQGPPTGTVVFDRGHRHPAMAQSEEGM